MTSVGMMFGQRRRRWPNIIPALGQRLVLTGLTPVYRCERTDVATALRRR